MISGDLRSALHSDLPHSMEEEVISEPVWRYLTDHIEVTPESVTWWSKGEERSSLWVIDEKRWSLRAGFITLATHRMFDMQACQHEWSIVPGWQALPKWWTWADGALERGEITQEIYDAPMSALVTKWKWCKGEATNEELRDARQKAWKACSRPAADAADAAAAAHYAAADAAAAAAANAADAAANAAIYGGVADARAAYSVFCAQFTEYVLYCIEHGKHGRSM